jgi:hypothetical protein
VALARLRMEDSPHLEASDKRVSAMGEGPVTVEYPRTSHPLASAAETLGSSVLERCRVLEVACLARLHFRCVSKASCLAYKHALFPARTFIKRLLHPTRQFLCALPAHMKTIELHSASRPLARPEPRSMVVRSRDKHVSQRVVRK